MFSNFLALPDKTDKSALTKFTHDHFDEVGLEFHPFELDIKENPSFLSEINDQNFREFGDELNKIWKVLGRKTTPDVYHNPDHYSFIGLNHVTVVPTGPGMDAIF